MCVEIAQLILPVCRAAIWRKEGSLLPCHSPESPRAESRAVYVRFVPSNVALSNRRLRGVQFRLQASKMGDCAVTLLYFASFLGDRDRDSDRAATHLVAESRRRRHVRGAPSCAARSERRTKTRDARLLHFWNVLRSVLGVSYMVFFQKNYVVESFVLFPYSRRIFLRAEYGPRYAYFRAVGYVFNRTGPAWSPAKTNETDGAKSAASYIKKKFVRTAIFHVRGCVLGCVRRQPCVLCVAPPPPSFAMHRASC